MAAAPSSSLLASAAEFDDFEGQQDPSSGGDCVFCNGGGRWTTDFSADDGDNRGSRTSSSSHGYRPCMYDVQGNLTCGLDERHKPRRSSATVDDDPATAGFGDPATVRRLRSSIGFMDPFGHNTSPRYHSYDRLNLVQTADGKPLKKPCCRCKCRNVGPCGDPMAVVKNPNSTCALCEAGYCDLHC